jgi:hypothetical protein
VHGPIDRVIDAQIRTAIDGKRLIQLTYKGRRRIVEPHDYGEKTGTVKLFVFQRSKESEHAVGWRFLDVSEIRDLLVLEQTFPGSRERSGQHHHSWDELYARVEGSSTH